MFKRGGVEWMVLVLLLSATSLFGQTVTGSITGRVTDNTGAVIPGATVQIQNAETGLARNVQSDTAGRYQVLNLPVGSYSVTVQQPGFRTEVRNGITLSVASEVVVNLELTVGALQERVEVTGEAPAIETTTAALSNLVTSTQISDLPLNGRSIDQLALLTPGVVWQTNVNNSAFGGEGVRLVINGARPTYVLYLLDGTVSSDYNLNGTSSVASESLGAEAIQEFRILTHSYSAEYGRASGGVFSAITRSGTNSLHGSVYEFVRNNIFDARDFFNLSQAPAPSPLPPYRRNQFGASAGGRIVKDKVFFFANWEAIRQRQGVAGTGTIPDLNAQHGLLACVTGGVPACPAGSPAGTLTPVGPGPNNGINPAVLPYLAFFPVPNGPNLTGGAARYFTTLSTAVTENYSMGRMDFRLSDKDSLYYRMVYDPSTLSSTAIISPFITAASNTYLFNVLSETHIFSPTALNEFRVAFNRTFPRTSAGSSVSIPASLNFLPTTGAMGSINFTGTAISTGAGTASFTGFGVGAPRDMLQNLFEETDTFTLVRGAHSFKFGVDVERVDPNYRWTPFGGGSGLGTYAFGTLSGFLLGKPTNLQFPELTGNSNPSRGWRQIVFGGFVEDSWRVRPNLTLTLGVRYEMVTAPTEVNGRSANLPTLTSATSVIGPAYQTAKNNSGPRFGLAWDPTGSGKTSVRAGFGMFYNLAIMGRIYDTSTFDYRFATSYTVNNPPNFPNALLSGYSPGSQVTRDLETPLQTPTSVQYNLQVSRQLTSTISVQVGYVGSHNYHLESGPQADRVCGAVPVSPTPAACPAPVFVNGQPLFATGLPKVNPNFGTIQWVTTPGYGFYNGLQFGVQKRLSGGLFLQGNYTWSKNTTDVDVQQGLGDIASQIVGPMDLNNLPRDYAPSFFNQTHVFSINGKYKMPWDNLLKSGVAKALLGGWEINSVWRAATGLPTTVGVGFNRSQNGDSLSSDRPNLMPGFSNNPSSGTTAGCTFVNGIPGPFVAGAANSVTPGQQLGTPTLYFDPCAFSLPTAGTYGNLGRNTVVGPGLFNGDAGLVKNTRLPWREGMALEFRGEVFNMLNHSNFRGPGISLFTNATTRNALGATITATSVSNRQIQLGMKLIF